MIATPGGAFEDKDADREIFDAVTKGLEGTGVKIVDDERNINDSGFAVAIAKQIMEMVGKGGKA